MCRSVRALWGAWQAATTQHAPGGQWPVTLAWRPFLPWSEELSVTCSCSASAASAVWMCFRQSRTQPALPSRHPGGESYTAVYCSECWCASAAYSPSTLLELVSSMSEVLLLPQEIHPMQVRYSLMACVYLGGVSWLLN